MDRDAAHLAAALAGRYRIERKLGHGGMAAVYLAHDLRHDRHVALKVLQPEVAQRLGSERFLREIRIVARLQHPHILTVLESGVVHPRRGAARRGPSPKQGLYWFTMPYVEGESLRDRLNREKQLPVEEALRIAHEAALGLDYAHRHGVIHRDIKPENILLTEDGSTLLADFGIARSVMPGSSEERLTGTGMTLGTPVYMSPEQAAAEREVDARTDIYSLGVVLYETLAGGPPFTGPTPQAVIAQRFGPEGHLALGMYYSRVARDFTLASREFSTGLRLSPNNADLLTLGGVNEEFRGEWDAALTHLRRAFALDPRSPGRARLLGYLLLRLRRYPEAGETLQRGLTLDSVDLDLIEDRAMVELARGNLAGARAVMRSAPRSVDPSEMAAHFATFWDLYWALDDGQQQLLLRLAPSSFGGNRGDWGIALAQTYWLRGNRARARAHADSARLAFREQLDAAPDDAQLHALHGLALAYLGREAEAVEEGKRAVSITPVSSDAYTGPYLEHMLVRIYLIGGENDKALDVLEPLLKIPYYLSPAWLRVDPAFTALQGNPRFEELAEP